MTEIEHDLRTWMQERAARVHASPEILETDYRPRNRVWRPRLAIGGGIAAVAGTVTAVLSLAGGGEHRVRRLERAADNRKPSAAAGSQQLLQREHPQSRPSAAGDRHPRAVHDHRLRRPGDIDADLQLLHGRARRFATRPGGPATRR